LSGGKAVCQAIQELFAEYRQLKSTKS